MRVNNGGISFTVYKGVIYDKTRYDFYKSHYYKIVE